MTDNITMNTVERITEICENRMKVMGITAAELARRTGLSETIFIMARKRNSYFRLETMIILSKALDIPLEELLGFNKPEKEYPADVQVMANILADIPEKYRVTILSIIKDYQAILSL